MRIYYFFQSCTFCILLTLASCNEKSPRPLPEVETLPISSITAVSLATGGNVLNDGGFSVIQRGVCWSASPNPTLNDTRTSDGAGGGPFNSSVTGLQPGQTYYIRSYATNQNGTSYGITLTATTLSGSIMLSTRPITEISYLSAQSGGNIQDSQGLPVTERGVCWSVTPNPTIDNNKVVNGSGTGQFISELTNLTFNTTYYVRAYAKNSIGTFYGQELTFKTLFPPSDADDNYYNEVKIGNQTWLRENLKTTRFQNGDLIAADKLSNYENNVSFNEPYGKLYHFDVTQDARKVCPTGFHVPTRTEWNQLVENLGGANIAGGKLKSVGLEHWAPPNTGADNSSGFTALPAGRRADDGSFAALSFNAVFWSSSSFDGSTAFYFSLFNSNSNVFSTGVSKSYQMSIRCIKD